MSIVEKVNQGIKEAMLSKDKVRLEALRGIKKEFLEAMTAKGSAKELSDEQAQKIISKLVKQRDESAKLYRDAGRDELAQNEEQEAAVLKSFLPEQLSEAEIRTAVQSIIKDAGVTDMKEMGKIMGIASKQLGAQADGRTISAIVKELLS